MDDTVAYEIVEVDGVAWKLQHVTSEVRGAFSRHARARVRASIEQDRKDSVLDAQQYRDELDALRDRLAAGAYDWRPPVGTGEDMGAGIREMIRGASFVHLSKLLLGKDHDKTPEAEIALVASRSGRDGKDWGDAVLRCLGIDPNSTGRA